MQKPRKNALMYRKLLEALVWTFSRIDQSNIGLRKNLKHHFDGEVTRPYKRTDRRDALRLATLPQLSGRTYEKTFNVDMGVVSLPEIQGRIP